MTANSVVVVWALSASTPRMRARISCISHRGLIYPRFCLIELAGRVISEGCTKNKERRRPCRGKTCLLRTACEHLPGKAHLGSARQGSWVVFFSQTGPGALFHVLSARSSTLVAAAISIGTSCRVRLTGRNSRAQGSINRCVMSQLTEKALSLPGSSTIVPCPCASR